MSIPYANRSAVAVIPALALRDHPRFTLDEVLEDFHGQYEPLNSYFYCVQFISTKKLRITFNSAGLMEDCLSAGLSLRGFPLEPQPISSKKWVSVQRLAIGIPTEAATRILGKFGKVFAAKHETKRGIYTGTLSILMDVQRNIPSALRIRGHTCLIFYRGQTRTCFRCTSPDHTTRDCPYTQRHEPTPGDDPPPTPETRDHPSDETPMSQDPPTSAESSIPPVDPVSPETAEETGQGDTQPEATTEASPAEDGLDGAHIDGPVTSEETNPSTDVSSQIDLVTDRVDTDRTGEATSDVPHPRDGAETTQASSVLSGLVADAAGEIDPTGSEDLTESDRPDKATTPTGAGETETPAPTVLPPPPASYACAVDPRASTRTPSEPTPEAVFPPPPVTDYPPISGSTATKADSEGFKIPRHSRRSRGRESHRMRSRSRSTSSADSTSSSGPPTRKRTQPSLVGTGHTSRRYAREINITLGQFGALQDFVADNPADQEIRLTNSGHLIPDAPVHGNLRPRPQTELDSSLESLLTLK